MATDGYGAVAPAKNEGGGDGELRRHRYVGRGLLLFCAALNGTLSVAIKVVYDTPDPPTAAALSAMRGIVAALALVIMLGLQTLMARGSDGDASGSAGEKPAQEQLPLLLPADVDLAQVQVRAAPPRSSYIAVAAELALWNVGAQGLQNLGLTMTTANRASFFLQLSVVITPLIQGALGQRVKVVVWLGALLCVVGLFFLTFNKGGETTDVHIWRMNMGDVFCISGAVCWSLYVLRISKVGERFEEFSLQCAKNVFMAFYYSLWAGVNYAQLASAASALLPLSVLWPGWRNTTAIAAIVYSSVGPGALEDVLQQMGQATTPAADSNVILSMEPLFTVIFSYLLVGDAMDPSSSTGGLLITVGALLASFA